MKYHISVNGQTMGPFEPEELINQCGLTMNSFVWNETMTDWQPASSVRELVDLLNAQNQTARPPMNQQQVYQQPVRQQPVYQQPARQQPVYQQPVQQQPSYQQPSYQQPVNYATDEVQNLPAAGAGLIIVSFLIPIAGVIGYFVKKDKVSNPGAYLIAALIGFITWFVLQMAME